MKQIIIVSMVLVCAFVVVAAGTIIYAKDILVRDNLKSITTYNGTKATTCNVFSCPSVICTSTTCNFQMMIDNEYEVVLANNTKIFAIWNGEELVIQTKNKSFKQNKLIKRERIK